MMIARELIDRQTSADSRQHEVNYYGKRFQYFLLHENVYLKDMHEFFTWMKNTSDEGSRVECFHRALLQARRKQLLLDSSFLSALGPCN